MPTLQTPSGTVYYEIRGQGRPLVFLHCPALSHVYWNPVVDHLASAHRCVTYDLRGHGQSSDTADDWGLEDLAADLHALIDGLRLQRPLLVSYSSSCTVAMKYLVRYPGTAAGAVLTGAFAQCKGLPLQGRVLAGLWTARPGLAGLQALAIAATNNVGREHYRQLKVCARQIRPHALHRLHQSTWKLNLVGELRTIREPVMLIAGQKDTVSNPSLPTLQDGLRHVTLRVFSGVDHHIPTKKLGLFVDQVAEFALFCRAGQPQTDFRAVPPAFMVAEPAMLHPEHLH